MLDPQLFVDNLLSPPVMFFMLGVIARAVRSDLEIPPTVAKLFSLYLLWAIGIKGGAALNEAGLSMDALAPVLAAIGLSAVTPIIVFPILRTRFTLADSVALAACFGSVSVVTFVAAAEFLESRGVVYGGEMVAALALMESPAIIVGLVLWQRLKKQPEGQRISKRFILKEAVTSGPVFLLMGSLIVGVVTAGRGLESIKPLSHEIFQGVLVLFLLEAGLFAGSRVSELKKIGLAALIAGIAIPIANACIGAGIAYLLGLSEGNALLFMILAGSASYIAVPAVMRMALPEASAGIYLPMSLGVTFPFNVCIGIPLYFSIIQALWPEAAPPNPETLPTPNP